MKKRLMSDWVRPIINSGNPFYFEYLTEGQKYRYNVIIPRIKKHLNKMGLDGFIKTIGGQVLVKTFAFHPDEIFTIFGDFKQFRVLLQDEETYHYRTNDADVYYYNTFPLFYIDDKGVMMVDNSLRDLFVRYFRKPENYYCRMLEEYGRTRHRENVIVVKFCDLNLKVPKMESMHISYRDDSPLNYSPIHSFRY